MYGPCDLIAKLICFCHISHYKRKGKKIRPTRFKCGNFFSKNKTRV